MIKGTLIWQEDLNEFIHEMYDFVQRNPVTFEDENEGYVYFANFVEQRFDKFWPLLYTGHYRNYN